MRSARTVVAEKRVAARSCGRGRGRWSCRGRGRGRWSNDGGRERRAWSRARTVVEQSDVRGVVRGDRIGARCVGVRSCRGRGGGDGTERTGRVTRRQRGAVVEALEVESVRRGLHGCRLLQLPVSRSAEVQRKEVSCRETGKTGEKRRWSCQCRVAVESADRSGRAARRQNRHRGIVVETSPHHLTRRTEEPGRAGGRAGGRAAEGTAEPA